MPLVPQYLGQMPSSYFYTVLGAHKFRVFSVAEFVSVIDFFSACGMVCVSAKVI